MIGRRFSHSEFKEAVQIICPNTSNLPTMVWLRLVATALAWPYDRVCRLWRDNRSKPEIHECIQLDMKLTESALFIESLRTRKKLQQQLDYQKNITGAVFENIRDRMSIEATPEHGSVPS